MRFKEAVNRYRGARHSFIQGYKDPEQFIYINTDDEVLQKWRVELPECPEWHYIVNFGLNAEDQFFKYEEYPIELKNLEEKIRDEVLSNPLKDEREFGAENRIRENIIRTLELEKRNYEDEIDWIRSQHWKRTYGEWQFINGRPYYIPPWQWGYLNYCKLEGRTDNDGLPDFRYRDYKWFWAQHYLSTTTDIPDLDENGALQLMEDGTPRMKRTKLRTSFGSNNLKGRRVGESSKASWINFDIATTKYDAYCGIQADTGDTAEQIYTKKLIYFYERLPFFMVPEVPSFQHSKELNFRSRKKAKGLYSKIDHATKADKSFYDSERLDYYHGDEIGKVVGGIDVSDRHDVVKRCMQPGIYINGFMVYTSTAENMDSDSGKKFEEMSMDSMFEQRGPDGRTKSGLINVYFDISESYEGFIDRYGFPIIDTPVVGYQAEDVGTIQHNDKGEIIGCRDYLESIKQRYIKDEDYKKLAGFKRKNPSSFKECFALAAMNQLFNSKKIQDRYEEIQFSNTVQVGDLVWVNGIGSKVEFRNTPNGRFKISSEVPEDKRSRWIQEGEYRRPLYGSVYIASTDAYRYELTDSWRQSDGAGAVLYKYDPDQDEGKPTIEWTSKKFVCTYCNRPPTKEEYCDDMLRMCVYYGAMLYPEMNVPDVVDYFRQKKYDGYLLYDVDRSTGKKKVNPGFTISGKAGNMKINMFNDVDNFVETHIDRCDHPEILQELLMIPGPEYMKDYDIFTVVAGCLKGERSVMIDAVNRFNLSKLSLDGWFPGYGGTGEEDIFL